MDYGQAIKVLVEACKDTDIEISVCERLGPEIYWKGMKVAVKPNEANKALKAIFVLHNLEAEES